MRRFAVVLPLLGLAAALLSGCATPPPPGTSQEDQAEYAERNDPYEPANRKFFAVNEFLDRNALHPVASAYRDTVPGTVRTHVHNVLSNLGNPAQLTNDVLQGRPRKAGNTFMRIVINTTAGAAGIFDVASGLGFPDHDTDFGLTLALWGVPSGPFLFLPVLGPNDPRDALGYGINTTLDPLTWLSFGGSNALGTSRFVVSAVDGRARLLTETDSIDKTALDPYATYRSLYQQHRESAVEDAHKDLPATVPNWYSAPSTGIKASPADTVPPVISPALAPPASTVP